jgi:hypothetical protein
VARGGAVGTFGAGRPGWLGHLGDVRNVVRQEMISRQLARHLRTPSDPDELAALLDVEERLGATDPYRQLGQPAHLIVRRPA